MSRKMERGLRRPYGPEIRAFTGRRRRRKAGARWFESCFFERISSCFVISIIRAEIFESEKEIRRQRFATH